MFYQRKKQKRRVLFCCSRIIFTFVTLLRTFENTRDRSTRDQMPVVFYRSVMHGLGFFICEIYCCLDDKINAMSYCTLQELKPDLNRINDCVFR